MRLCDSISDATLDTVFRALADPTRRAMLRELMSGPRGATSFAAGKRMSQPALSKHLRVLREAGLIRSRAQGRVRLCELRPERLRTVREWMETYLRFWEERLDAIEALVGEKEPSDRRGSRPQISGTSDRVRAMTRKGRGPKQRAASERRGTQDRSA
jgi:DNA-binding transcriptional ArsR family regulator